MDNLSKTLEVYLVKKAPALPKNMKGLIVDFAPWIEIIGVIATIPGITALWGFNAMMYGTPYGGYMAARSGFNFTLPAIFLIVAFVLMLLSIPGLFKRSKMGWNYAYYSVLVNAIYSLLTMQLLGMVVGSGISLYLLFQVKSYYK